MQTARASWSHWCVSPQPTRRIAPCGPRTVLRARSGCHADVRQARAALGHRGVDGVGGAVVATIAVRELRPEGAAVRPTAGAGVASLAVGAGRRLWLRYAPWRVSCRHCGVRVERVSWPAGSSAFTGAVRGADSVSGVGDGPDDGEPAGGDFVAVGGQHRRDAWWRERLDAGRFDELRRIGVDELYSFTGSARAEISLKGQGSLDPRRRLVRLTRWVHGGCNDHRWLGLTVTGGGNPASVGERGRPVACRRLDPIGHPACAAGGRARETGAFLKAGARVTHPATRVAAGSPKGLGNGRLASAQQSPAVSVGRSRAALTGGYARRSRAPAGCRRLCGSGCRRTPCG